jgi:hypothetical protein
VKPGFLHLILGLVLLGGGIAITVLSEQVVAWGAIAVGLYYAIKGVVLLARKT